MKTLIIVRHAKSPAALPGETDFDRGLTESGKKDAADMGKKLFEDGLKIDAFVSSPAKRAKKTCKAFAEAYGREKGEIIYVDELYHASSATYYRVTEGLDDQYNSAAIFAHNPGITDFVNTLCEKVDIYNMPKAGVFAVRANIKNWKEFGHAEREFLFFKDPKTNN